MNQIISSVTNAYRFIDDAIKERLDLFFLLKVDQNTREFLFITLKTEIINFIDNNRCANIYDLRDHMNKIYSHISNDIINKAIDEEIIFFKNINDYTLKRLKLHK